MNKYLVLLGDESKPRGRRGEKQLSQMFWRDFFAEVCGVTDPLVAGIEFERGVRMRSNDIVGWIDVLWPQVVLIEHKSVGKNLDVAENEARDYLISLEAKDRPPVIIVSDFLRILSSGGERGMTVANFRRATKMKWRAVDDSFISTCGR